MKTESRGLDSLLSSKMHVSTLELKVTTKLQEVTVLFAKN